MNSIIQYLKTFLKIMIWMVITFYLVIIPPFLNKPFLENGICNQHEIKEYIYKEKKLDDIRH